MRFIVLQNILDLIFECKNILCDDHILRSRRLQFVGFCQVVILTERRATHNRQCNAFDSLTWVKEGTTENAGVKNEASQCMLCCLFFINC